MFMKNTLAATAVLAIGCSPAAESITPIDRVCAEAELPLGDTSATRSQRLGVQRVNCHRAVMGLAPTVLEASLDFAAQNHAEYLRSLGSMTHRQAEPELPGYLGEWPGDRAVAGGYVWDAQEESLSEVISFVETGNDPAFAVDQWMSNVYHREPLVQPELVGAGFGSLGEYDVMLTCGPWVSDGGVRSAGYPSQGQWAVPTSFDSDREVPDPMPDHGIVGYPISLTFLAPGTSGQNLYDLDVRPGASRLTDEDGANVPVRLLQPNTDPRLIWSAFLVPEQPLMPLTEYEARFVGTVGDVEFDERWTFTTGAE